jgi:hypothetical protein
LLDTENAKLKIGNFRITHGPASVDQQGNITVWESNNENA